MLLPLHTPVAGTRRHLVLAGTRPWVPRLAVPFLLVVLVVQVNFWVREDYAGQLPVAVGLRLLTVAIFALGVLSCRPGFRSDWSLMLGAVVLWTLADTDIVHRVLAVDLLPAWLPSEPLSLGAFALMALGVVRLARRDGFVRGTSVRLDAAVVTISVAACWWLVVGRKAMTGEISPAALQVGVNAAGDAVLLVAAVALMSSHSAHSLSSRVLVVASMVAIWRDLAYGLFTTGAMDSYPIWLQSLRMVQFALYAAAALLSGSAPRSYHRASSISLGLVVIALVAPALVLGILLTGLPGEAMPWWTVWFVGVATAVMAMLLGMRVIALVRRLERQAARLETTARTDALTSLPNRRAGSEWLEQWLCPPGPDLALAVAMVDVDHFKAFNDTYGHLQGDCFLRAAALCWEHALAGQGQIFRFGGEEFLVVMPGKDEAAALALLARMRLGTPLGQSFSAGVACWRSGDDLASLVGRADQSLYAAKAAGRSRTVAAG